MDGPIHSFGPFRYDAGQRVLLRDGEVVALVPKAVDTLHALLERRGQIVEKAELMKMVWPDTTVEEIGLARNISLLRKALGDDNETYIETVPRRGYRVAAIATSAPPPRRPWKWLLAPACLLVAAGFLYWQFYAPSRYLPRRADAAGLAVVPFECLGSAEPALSQEFNEILVAEISRLPSVQVISPSTVRRYQRLGISSVHGADPRPASHPRGHHPEDLRPDLGHRAPGGRPFREADLGG
ncbi:MAG TPA: transcriptional regulator [Bryobacteraceae bacterium]|nr:transcriptional regulator [Bryobacteraceae bacterium]